MDPFFESLLAQLGRKPDEDLTDLFVPGMGKPYYETSSPALAEHFRIGRLIENAASRSDLADMEKFSREQIAMAPAAFEGFRTASEANHSPFRPPIHPGYSALASLLFIKKAWQEVIALEAEASAAGWSTVDMHNSVKRARAAAGEKAADPEGS